MQYLLHIDGDLFGAINQLLCLIRAQQNTSPKDEFYEEAPLVANTLQLFFEGILYTRGGQY